MAEVTPSDPKGTGGGASVGGTIVGGFIGLFVGAFLSVLALGMAGLAWNGSPSHGAGACGAGIVAGILLLAAVAAVGWVAWYMDFRNTSRTFGAGFLRGLSTIVAIFLLIPWPCSYTWAAIGSFSACAR